MKTKRTDAEKAYIEHVQQLRRGSRTSRIPSGKTYKRKPKHKDSYATD